MNLPLISACMSLVFMLQSCAQESPSSVQNSPTDLPQVSVTLAEADLHSFVSSDTLAAISGDLLSYFQCTNEARWDDLMHHFPLHKLPEGDTSFVNGSKRALEYWTEHGVRNRTESARIVYASPSILDNDQEVVLLNMELSHYVEFFPNYEGPPPSGMKGMVESNYGKGNAVYKEGEIAEGDSIPLKYWEIKGLSRIWAVSHVDSAHWCFLPPNFNESGSAYMMGGDAMVEALRHRRNNDPTAKK